MILGVDGEGQGRHPHKYIYLAASTEDGRVFEVADRKGLSSQKCLGFLVALPEGAKCFAFSFGYDITKIIQDLPNRSIWALLHPEARAIPGTRARRHWVPWRRFELDWFNGRLSVRRRGASRAVVVWDVFRFFATKFTETLKAWGVGSPEELEHLQAMKSKRGDFDRESFAGVKKYCQLECRRLAELVRKLIEAHDAAGLHLTQFYGAGSTSGALLKVMNVRKFKADPPEDVQQAVARAFVGGRFENSHTGALPGPVHAKDISAAYPYQMTFLPCLKHGNWEHHRGRGLQRRIEQATLACVDVSVAPANPRPAWAPFPFRSSDGSVCFPLHHRTTVWKDEFLEGQKWFDGIQAHEAWCYTTDCGCRPFGEMPHYYKLRLQWGKEGRGIVVKLGTNGGYGKTAQSKGGGGPFTSWIWAGNITSATRAHLLQSFGLVRDPWDLYMFATDSVWSAHALDFPKPRDTGTFDTAKPLGGWEEKIHEKGVFAVRPGIYFPMRPTVQEIKDVRARGLGRAALFDAWSTITKAHRRWNKKDPNVACSVGDITRFVGARTSVYLTPKGQIKRREAYGEWEPWPIDVSFDPMPKREKVLGDGRRLLVRDVGGRASSPYPPALGEAPVMTPEIIALMFAEQVLLDQPDADLCDYEVET